MLFVTIFGHLFTNHIIKGQLILKRLFDVIVSTEKPMIFFPALASKKRWDQKNKGT